ncbi:SRPBCC family protein [Oceaniradius stylonematis]|uniref:SRPBCC family protein n=1 Tax=Oceaniradius stylonematis TaxID=2184161 RepID=UPI003C7A0BC4
MVTHPIESASAPDDDSSATAFTIDRVFDAPVDLVWRCFTEKAHVDVWMLPERFALIEQDADVSVGGKWWSKMLDQSDGAEWHVGGTYREVVQNQRLVFTHHWTKTPSGGGGSEHLIAIDFEARHGKTHMRFVMSGLPDTGSRDGHREGWAQTLGHLEQHLATLAEAAR